MVSIAIKSASRPKYLRRTLRSLRKYLNFGGLEEDWVVHEDVLELEKSASCLLVFDEELDNYGLKLSPPGTCQNNAKSIEKLINICPNKYMVHWEDDWELLKEVDLEKIVNVMEYNDDINMICFNRGFNKPYSHIKYETWRSGSPLVECYDWVLFPAVWRTEFVKERFDVKYIKDNCDDIGKMLGRFGEGLGVYFWGGFGNGKYIKHIGARSTRDMKE